MITEDNVDAVSFATEPTGRTYLLRRLSVLVFIVTVCALGFLAAVGLPSPGLAVFNANSASAEMPGPAQAPAGDVAQAVPPQPVAPQPVPPQTVPPQTAVPQTTLPPATPPQTGLPPSTVSPTPRQPETVPDPQPPASPPDGLGPRASRLIAQRPQRVLDTRKAGEATPETVHEISVEANRTAVALSVSILNSTGSGSVFVDGGAGTVEAIEVAGPEVTTTNLVMVPVIGNRVTVRSSAGGDLTVDVVGTFEASASSASGRFVPINPVRLAQLETAVDGRETSLPLVEATPGMQAAALLVVVTADVGADGGMVRLGTAEADFDQMLMWAPENGDNRQRRGLVLIEPGTDRSGYLRYDGGSVLTADVVGYFTGEDAVVGTGGLYVPAGPRNIFDGLLEPGSPVVIGAVNPGRGTAFVTLSSGAISPGQLGSFLVPVADGSITLRSAGSIDANATLLGVFTAQDRLEPSASEEGRG